MFDVKLILYSKVKSIANPMVAQEMIPMIPTVPMDPAQTIELEMKQWEFELGFRF